MFFNFSGLYTTRRQKLDIYNLKNMLGKEQIQAYVWTRRTSPALKN